MRNRMYGGVRGRKTRVGEKLHRFPPTRFLQKSKKNRRTFLHFRYIKSRGGCLSIH